LPAFLAFCRECAGEPFRDWQPSGREPPLVADALAETRAAQQLLSAPADDRILIVVSDGMPAGRRCTEQDLRNVVRLLVREPRLIVVGIGPDIEHVRDFYPHSRASVALDRFAGAIAELLRAVLE
jgi:cobalamin biosynthesis protein CobT